MTGLTLFQKIWVTLRNVELGLQPREDLDELIARLRDGQEL